MPLSRLDRKFTAAGEAPLDAAELLAGLGVQGSADAHVRQEAIARYLAGEKGWRDALALLGGTFADGCEGTKLRPDKDR